MRLPALLLLSLLCIAARGETLLICENQAVPPGYAVVQRAMPANDCGSWRSGPNRWTPYTKMKIAGLDVQELVICDGRPQTRIPPPGYVVVSRGITGVRCGSWRSGANSWKPYTGIRIKKLN